MAAMSLAVLGLVAGPAIGSIALVSPESTECLRWQGEEGGCESIRNEEDCLSRRDGRPWAQWDGLLIAGQPCSWCGGEECANNSEALCMPFDWVKHRANLSTANCSKGESVKAWSSQAPAKAHAVGDDGARFEEPANHTRCGASRLEDSKTFNKYYWTFTAVTSEECKATCAARPFCTGFGFEASHEVCKVWWHPIDSTEPSDHASDECVKAVNESAVEPRAADDDQQVMFQESDDPQGNATALEVQAGMSDGEKAAIAGGVVGGVAAAGLLGGLLGGLLPQHAASTTTMMDGILRMMEDNDTNFTNSTNESFLLGAAGDNDEGASIPPWVWWLLVAVAVLTAAICVWLIARLRDYNETMSDSDDDLESLSARSHFAAAEQEPLQEPPTLLSRAAAPMMYHKVHAATEPVQAARVAVPFLGRDATPVPPRFAEPAARSAGPVVHNRFFEPVATPPRHSMLPPPPTTQLPSGSSA